MRECYRCWAEVDLNALRENLAQIRRLAGREKKVITVVKADAYGHGLREIATVLMQSGTDVFGVANLSEARAIRSLGKGWPILMLGACLPVEVEAAVRDDVMPTISSYAEAAQFSQVAQRLRKTVAVHLKLDTGMGRLGVSPDQAVALARQIGQLPGVQIKGLYTHYSAAEDDAPFTQQQRIVFTQLAERLLREGQPIEWLHARNSGGLLFESDHVCNTVRPGLLVYGLIPKGARQGPPGLDAQFQPALSWKCRVGLVRSVPANTPVSYGHTYFTAKAARLATLTAGYGDGYMRAASGRAQVLIGQKRCPILGRVTMDQIIVDVSDLATVQPGDEVVLIGGQGSEQISVLELADWCQTVPWEILTNITYRVPRVYTGGHAA